MESPSPENLRAWLVQVCKPSWCPSATDLLKLKAWTRALRAFQADGYVSFIRSHVRRPILCSYSSDATPQSVAIRIRRPESLGNVQRAGRSTSDYLLQRCILKSFNNSGGLDMHLLSHPPVPLTHGKRRWHVLTCFDKFAPSMRELGHHGFSILHVCFDRGFGHALDRAIIQHQYQRHASREELPNGGHTYPGEDSELIDEQLLSLMLHALRFVGFSESRWGSLGDSSRCLLLCLSLGLPTLIQIAQKGKKSQYCLAGTEDLQSPQLCQFVLESALATASPDAVLSSTLSDDRVILTQDELMEIMHAETTYMLNVSPSVWRRLCLIGRDDRAWACLRSDVLANCRWDMRTYMNMSFDPWASTPGR